MKVLLILSDGMRPDAVGGHKVVDYLKENGAYCMNARTVMPSVTLPCHMSLFHSVDPERHGTTTNIYVPQMRPVSGLFEQLDKEGKKCAMLYSWEELRDVVRPGVLCRSVCVSGDRYGYKAASRELFETAKDWLRRPEIDFLFLYFADPDVIGHEKGWMSEEYKQAVKENCDMVGELIRKFGDEWRIIYTADHGGHGRMHGMDIPEDMTIPLFFLGQEFEAGREMANLSIKDIAPTVAALFEAEIPKEWEGKNLLEKDETLGLAE